jgi:hypothetical protein
MAYSLDELPSADPTSFPSGRRVTITFKAARLSGSGRVSIVYTGVGVTLNGEAQQTRARQLANNSANISEAFRVEGPPGIRSIMVDISDSDNSDSNDVVVRLQ